MSDTGRSKLTAFTTFPEKCEKPAFLWRKSIDEGGKCAYNEVTLRIGAGKLL